MQFRGSDEMLYRRWLGTQKSQHGLSDHEAEALYAICRLDVVIGDLESLIDKQPSRRSELQVSLTNLQEVRGKYLAGASQKVQGVFVNLVQKSA